MTFAQLGNVKSKSGSEGRAYLSQCRFERRITAVVDITDIPSKSEKEGGSVKTSVCGRSLIGGVDRLASQENGSFTNCLIQI